MIIKKINIKRENKNDYEKVEKMTRETFYNLYIPGCVEHYLVHIMREHEDFIPELDLVIELDGNIIGNIIFDSSSNYVSSGFKCCKKYNICMEKDIFPAAMMEK